MRAGLLVVACNLFGQALFLRFQNALREPMLGGGVDRNRDRLAFATDPQLTLESHRQFILVAVPGTRRLNKRMRLARSSRGEYEDCRPHARSSPNCHPSSS